MLGSAEIIANSDNPDYKDGQFLCSGLISMSGTNPDQKTLTPKVHPGTPDTAICKERGDVKDSLLWTESLSDFLGQDGHAQ